LNQKLLLHFTSSGFYTSLCLASLSISTDIILLHRKPDAIYFIFLFFVTFFYYNFQKISWFGHQRMLQKDNLKYTWPAQFPGLLFLSLLVSFAITVGLITICLHQISQLFLALIAGILAISYNLNIFGIHLRSKKGCKALVIAIVAVISSVLIPIANVTWDHIDGISLLLYTIAQFLFITALCIAADMRDVTEDREDKIKTFPVAAGLTIAKKIIFLLLVLQTMLLIVSFQLGNINLHQLEAFMLVSLLTVLFIGQLHQNKSYFYFILGIDGLILLQTICILIS
jgi:hypothetical protein